LSLFIVFEGGDGSGKTVQSKTLYKYIKEHIKKVYENSAVGKRKPRKPKLAPESVIHTQEPGNTVLGQLLRRMLKHPHLGKPVVTSEAKEPQLQFIEPHNLDTISDIALPDIILGTSAPRAELLFFMLARAQHVEDIIKPKLSLKTNDGIVICDRYIYSTVAYQGYGRGLDIDLINEANRIATQGIEPDIVILLDISAEEGLRRILRRKKDLKDYFDDKEISFHNKVREGYLAQAKNDPDRWLVIDATLSRKEIRQIIWGKLSDLLKKANLA